MDKIFATVYLDENSKSKKYSLITDSMSAFDHVVNTFAAKKMPDAISVLLVDIATRSIIDERWFPMI